ncbi:MAG: glycosyltransferase [Chitinophagaceae bacterium]|nr:glycosyltransferase [Chitinophagaceae bacterium]
MSKIIFFTVTNDLTYDQRMERICTTLSLNGYQVVLVGRQLRHSTDLTKKTYRQKRLKCFFGKGKLFYAEYNLRLFFYLLFQRMDAVCAIDLDTILPVYFISRIKKIPRIYDAHELFSELKEVVTRPVIQKIWRGIEKRMIPLFSKGYTVCESLAEEFQKRYGVHYAVIRNMPWLDEKENPEKYEKEKFILYQGAVNEARGFEWIIPAMREIPYPLVICGDGNYMSALKKLIFRHNVQDKVILKGMLLPQELKKMTRKAYIGITPAEPTGLNQWLALPNKFFDYIHAGTPQIAMNFPEYRKINEKYGVAVLIDNLLPETLLSAVNKLFDDVVLYESLKKNCLKARKELNWQEEQKNLLQFYSEVLPCG